MTTSIDKIKELVNTRTAEKNGEVVSAALENVDRVCHLCSFRGNRDTYLRCLEQHTCNKKKLHRLKKILDRLKDNLYSLNTMFQSFYSEPCIVQSIEQPLLCLDNKQKYYEIIESSDTKKVYREQMIKTRKWIKNTEDQIKSIEIDIIVSKHNLSLHNPCEVCKLKYNPTNKKSYEKEIL